MHDVHTAMARKTSGRRDRGSRAVQRGDFKIKNCRQRRRTGPAQGEIEAGGDKES
jgi:hypothetical protein